ncbi:MAG TPA: ECF transporter S component [Bacteroidota bacterium]|nr:ECF transporter S component [Bacteroidota bacterium]
MAFSAVRERFLNETKGAAIPLIAVGIGVNLVMGEITSLLRIPLYLDSVGTVFIGVTFGPYAGMVCGLFSNVAAGILVNPPMIFFAPVAMIIGAFSGFVASRGGFSSYWKAGFFGLLQGVLTAFASAPIAAFVFGGLTMGGTDFLVLYFRSMGNSILNSVFYQGLAADPLDKCCSYLLVFFAIARLPLSLRSRLPQLVKR